MRSAHIEQQHQAKRSTHLRTTTIGDSVFVINPRPLYIIRPDERTEAKLRICSRTCVDKLEHRIRPDEEDVTHMTKAKLSKGFELIGEHLPLPKCERSPGAGGEVQEVRQASCGRRLKLCSDVSGLSDKIPCHFFRSHQFSSHEKNDLLPAYTPISRRKYNSGYLRPSHPTPTFKVRYDNALRWPVFELNPSTGELLRSTASLEDTKLDALLKAGPIRCAAVDFEYTHLATVGDDKQLKVWAVESLQLLSERYGPCRFRILSTHD
jgi:hypothetical protein